MGENILKGDDAEKKSSTRSQSCLRRDMLFIHTYIADKPRLSVFYLYLKHLAKRNMSKHMCTYVQTAFGDVMKKVREES